MRTSHQTFRQILDLEKSTREIARWRVRLVEFNFEIVHNPGLYVQAAAAMVRLSKTGTNSPNDEQEFDNDNPTFLTVEQEPSTHSTTVEDYCTTLTIPTAKNLSGSPQTNTYFQPILK